MRLRYGEDFAGTTQADPLRRERSTLGGVDGDASIRPATCSARRRSRSRRTACASSPPATTRTSPIRPARRSSSCPATSSSPRRRSACRCSATAIRTREIAQAAAFGRAVSRARASRRRLFARQGAARDRAAPQGRLRRADLSARRDGEDHALLRRAAASISASCELVARREARRSSPARSRSARPRRSTDLWSRRFPDPVTCFASGWMRVRARARQRGVELPLVISDHADWDELTATIAATGASRGLGHARPGGCARALVRDARPAGAAARHRRLWRRGRERRHADRADEADA